MRPWRSGCGGSPMVRRRVRARPAGLIGSRRPGYGWHEPRLPSRPRLMLTGRVGQQPASGERRVPGPRPTPVEHYVAVRHAEEVLRRAMQRQLAREAVGEQPPKARLRVNLTDPQSRLMPTRKGWLQGYNVQVGVSGDQLIVATRVSQHTNDSEDFIPMMAAVQQAAGGFQAAGREDAVVGVLLADAGYATDTNLAAPGPDRLTALGSRRNQHRAAAHRPTQGPPPEAATPREAMRHRLRTPEGVATYKRRGATAEPAIGNLKKIINGLSRRGLRAATAEINLAAAAFNLLKIYRAAATSG